MAFELPDHLPRGGVPQDKPTQVLTKIGQTTYTTLNASLATSWATELDSSIQATKSRIFQRIHDDFTSFERQCQTSMSIQARSSELSNGVDGLADSLNNPKTGILPTLLQKLTAHEILSAQTHDSEVIHSVSKHLLHIRSDLYKLSEQNEQGQLPESAQTCVSLQRLITDAPEPLKRAEIMTAIQKRYRTLSDRLQEQLTDAYARSVRISSSDDAITLTILSSTSVPPTSTVISLSAILQSLTPDSLSTSLSSFRRDVLTKFIDVVLLSSRPISVTALNPSSSSLSLSLTSKSPTPLQSLETFMTFLNSHFFPHLPSIQASFPATLHGPITSAVLNHLLEPSIPSSLPAFPSFLDTVDEALRFEDSFLSGNIKDGAIRHWANDVAGHYEKKRRENFLRQVKEVSNQVESPREEEDTFDGWGWGDEDMDGEEADKVEPQLKPQQSLKEDETFLVSLRAKRVLAIVEDVMREGQELMNSNVFTKQSSTKTTTPGQLLIAAVPTMLDLHRALYPITHSTLLLGDPNLAIRWSNDCKFLSAELSRLCDLHRPASTERWLETAERLMTLGELCYENVMLNNN